MNTRLTVADCRTNLYSEVDPGNINTDLFIPWLNEVSERYINNGKWKGAIVSTTFPSSAGFITLPPEFQGVLAMRYRRFPGSSIFSQFHPYMENGPGDFNEAQNFPGVLTDMGDGFPTRTDIPVGLTCRLRVTLSNVLDAAKTFRFYGLNGDSEEIYADSTSVKGLSLTSAFPSADTPATTRQLFSRVTGIQAPSNLVGSWTLSYINGGAATEIGFYLPWETRPMYRRYQTGIIAESTDDVIPITVICQRRFVLLRDETDWVIPGNLTALRYGLKMRYYEERQDIDKAQAAFQAGLDFLNQEAKSSRAGVQPDMNISLFGTSHAFPWAN